jgi:hypothetical protein
MIKIHLIKVMFSSLNKEFNKISEYFENEDMLYNVYYIDVETFGVMKEFLNGLGVAIDNSL